MLKHFCDLHVLPTYAIKQDEVTVHLIYYMTYVMGGFRRGVAACNIPKSSLNSNQLNRL